MTEPLRIAFIRYRYDPFGGAERFTQTLAESLAARGIEVHILAHDWKANPGKGIHLHRIGGPSWPSILAYSMFVFLVGRAVRAGNFDLVQSNERTLCQDIYRAGDGVHARWLEIRSTGEGMFRRLSFRLNPFHRLRLFLEKTLFEDPRLKAVIVNSEMVKKEILERFDLPPERIHTIYNGVDLDRFSPTGRPTHGMALRREYGIDDRTPVVLFVGSGFERKGLRYLLEGFAKAGGDARLWVVGKGKTTRYEKMAERAGIRNRTVFFGPRRDTAPFYAAADIFAFPTLYDPFPSVVLEAMASGLPVITTAQCGAAEILSPGVNGFVLDSPEDTDGLAKHLETLFDEKLRLTFSMAARTTAEGFSTENTMQHMEKLYETLLQ